MSKNRVDLWVEVVKVSESLEDAADVEVLMRAARELKRLQKVEDVALAEYMDMLATEKLTDSTDYRMLVKAADRLRELGD